MIKSHNHDLPGGGLGLVTDKKNTTTTTKNKSRAEQEPRSAHGRVVNKCKSLGVFNKTIILLSLVGYETVFTISYPTYVHGKIGN